MRLDKIKENKYISFTKFEIESSGEDICLFENGGNVIFYPDQGFYDLTFPIGLIEQLESKSKNEFEDIFSKYFKLSTSILEHLWGGILQIQKNMNIVLAAFENIELRNNCRFYFRFDNSMELISARFSGIMEIYSPVKNFSHINYSLIFNDNLQFAIRKDLEKPILNNKISNSIFILMLNEKMLTVIDDFEKDYSSEEIEQLKILVDMMEI